MAKRDNDEEAAGRRRSRDRARKRVALDRAEEAHGFRVWRGDLETTRNALVRRQSTADKLIAQLLAYSTAVCALATAVTDALEARTKLTAEEKEYLRKAKSRVYEDPLDRAVRRGVIRFPVSEVAAAETRSEIAAASSREGPETPTIAAAKKRLVLDWVSERIASLMPVGPDTPRFEVADLGFVGPLFVGGLRPAEGIQTATGVVRALAPRERASEPVQIIIGGPGAGKTHQALELLARAPGTIYAYAPTPGARAQFRQLRSRLGLDGRVKVVDRPGDLRRRSRVLIDEASLVRPSILHNLRDTKELWLAGDAGQSAAKPGESILAAMAALDAPVIELTGSRRTSSEAIRAITQFVSATQQPFIPGIARIVPDKAVSMTHSAEDDDFDNIVGELSKHSDSLAIVWSLELEERLKAVGVRAYLGNMAQGCEADHVVVHMPAAWTDLSRTPDVPLISFLNGICRARRGATIVSSANVVTTFMTYGPEKQRILDLEEVGIMACEDARRPYRNPLSRWDDSRWELCEFVTDVLFKYQRRADLFGDWLYVFKISDPSRYVGAIRIGEALLGVTSAMILERGLAWCEEFATPLGDFNGGTTKSQIRSILKSRAT